MNSQVRLVDGFLRLMAQTTRTADSREDVPFGGFVDIVPHLGGKYPQTPILGALIGVFTTDRQNIESFMLSKLLHRF